MVDDPAHLAVAYRGRVLVDAFPPAGEAPLAGPIKRRQIGLYDAENRIVADGVLRFGRSDRLPFAFVSPAGDCPPDMELVAGEVGPFEPHELAAAQSVIEEQGEHGAHQQTSFSTSRPSILFSRNM